MTIRPADPPATSRTALIVVDVQNDFCEGGTLPVRGGGAVARRLAEHLARHRGEYALVVATRDWHLPDHDNDGHVAGPGREPDFTDTWPAHCVQGTPGADYHPALAAAIDLVDVHAVKGSGTAAYSGFEARTVEAEGSRSLRDVLAAHGITEVVVAGLATDYCVLATVLDARRHGFATAVLSDLVAGVAPESARAALARMADAGADLRPVPALAGRTG